MIGTHKIHANFSVDDMAAAKAFYVDKLGFKVIKEEASDMVLEGGTGARINIYEKADHTPWDSTVLGIEADDVEQAVSELSDIGVNVEKIPGSDSFGIVHDPEMGDAAWFRDPAQNWVCVSNVMA
jgi:catechol 2,3-dioxygenase-like lactoylglutathione lyase family enzyme